MLTITICLFVIFYFGYKSNMKMTEKIIEIVLKTYEMVNNTNATQTLIKTMQNENGANRKKLNNTHDDIKEIEFRISILIVNE